METAALTIRKAAPAIYLPALTFEIGQGAVTPVIALSAIHAGASVSVAAVVVAMLGIGQLLGDVPAGMLAHRIGERNALMAAAGLGAAALTVCALIHSVWALALGVTVAGAANAMVSLARQAYLTEFAPPQFRARALSTLGGVGRIGFFIGPFVGALAVHQWDVHAAFYVGVAASAAAGLVVLLVPEPQHLRRTAAPTQDHPTDSVRTLFARYRHLFFTLGLCVTMVSAVRASRQIVLPLWSEHLGMDAATTSVVFGISGAVDMLLFYPSGKLMDRRGRLWIAVPSMAVLGASILVLPLTHNLISLTLVAMTMGFGNGIGSGILMTLGADVAPAHARSQFLGMWRLFADTGNAGGPALVSAAAAAGSLAAGILACGLVSVGCIVALLRWVPRYSPHANRSTRVANGMTPDGLVIGSPTRGEGT